MNVSTYALASRHMQAVAEELGHATERHSPTAFTAGGVTFHRTSSSPLPSIRSTRNKTWCKERFRTAGVTTPQPATEYPCIQKPRDGTGGVGVRIITNPAERMPPGHFREEFIHGVLHRVFVVGDAAVAALKQTPAFVIGDGRSTIRQLAAAKSRNRPTPAFAPIQVLPHLQNTIPPEGETVTVHYLATRGIGADVTQTDPTPALTTAAVTAVAAIPGLTSGGVDLIERPDGTAAVLEVNSVPHVQAHYTPQAGIKKDPLRALVEATLGRRQ